MSSTISCPNCKHQFEPEAAMRQDMDKQLKEQEENLRRQMKEWKVKTLSEFENRESKIKGEIEQKELELQKKLQEEKAQWKSKQEEELRKIMQADFETQVTILKETLESQNEKLKESREKEMEYYRKEQALKAKEEELEITLQKKILEERTRISENLKKEETEKFNLKETEFKLKEKEWQEQLTSQKRLIDEMKRKAEQGSMQMQGEVQELVIEEILKQAFPFDKIIEVGKGKRGADCIQIVHNKFGQECGRIIFESKRTENFGGDWIEKLKMDMRSNSADVALLVTKTMPKELDNFGEKDGVWICTFQDTLPVVALIRDGIIKIHQAAASQENSGEKMTLLYNYLTSSEFSGQWAALREGFLSMKQSIQKERDAFERLWKSREKQLEKVLLSASHIKGAIEGISGLQEVDLNLLTDEQDLFLK